MPRPSKRTPETEKRILDCLRAGVTRRAACHHAGISEDTFANWQQRFSDFSDAVARAESDCAVRSAAVVQKAATGYDQVERKTVERTVLRKRRIVQPDGTKVEEEVPIVVTDTTTTTATVFDWRAAAWWLERRGKPDWSPRAEVSGADGESIAPVVIVRGVSLDDI